MGQKEEGCEPGTAGGLGTERWAPTSRWAQEVYGVEERQGGSCRPESSLSLTGERSRLRLGLIGPTLGPALFSGDRSCHGARQKWTLGGGRSGPPHSALALLRRVQASVVKRR